MTNVVNLTPAAEALDQALNAAIDTVALRTASLKLSSRYHQGTRYTGDAAKLGDAASRFYGFMFGQQSNDRSPAAQAVRKTALEIAISHLCKPRSMVSVDKVLAAARSFETYLGLET